MSKVIFKAKCMQFKNGCLLIPCTPSDRYTLNSFAETAGSHVITVTANYARSNKTYDQCKTVFALINLLFQSQKNRMPTENEQALVYSRLLWKYADRVDDPLSGDKVPVSLSHMDVGQAAYFINSIMGEIYENIHGLTDVQQVDLRELFEEFYANNAFGEMNPIDYDKDGNMLSEEEWRKKNHFSFASFSTTEDLQLHHILSRGALPQYKDCSWNWIMLTDYEHNRIFHDHGWDYFLEVYPHCALRIKTAFDMGHQLYSMDLQKALIKLGLLDSLQDEIPEEEGLF